MSTNLIILIIITLFVLLVFSAFFSASETAYSTVPRARIEEGIKKGKRSAVLIKKHYQNFGWTLATILLSNNLVNIGASSLATYLLSDIMGASSLAALISTFVMTPIIVIFGEIAPKLVAKRYAYVYLSFTVYLIDFFNYLFFPFTFPISRLALSSKTTNTENDLRVLLKVASDERVLQKEEAILARKALDLDSAPIAKIMTQEKDINFLEDSMNVETALKLFVKTTHSRMPLKKGDKFVGMILLKDLIFANHSDSVQKFSKKIVYVSKNTLATIALEKMRLERSQIALVTNSNNSKEIVGLVTIEDIIEELVGEIYDEHDIVDEVVEISNSRWVVRPSTELSKVFLVLGINVEAPKNYTLRDWMETRLKKEIKKNLEMTYDKHFHFKVITDPKNRKLLIRIEKK